VSDWPYRFEILDVNELVVDESYQRPLTSFAKRIERGFDPALVGTLVVSRRDDGTQAVVDGQTRAAAIRTLAGEGKVTSTVPCLVYVGMSQADEASLFVRLQKERRGMHSYERFRAALVAGDPEAIAIKAICDRLGYRLGQGANELSAVSALEKVYRRSPKVLERTLRLLRKPWGGGYMPSGDMVKGVGRLFDEGTEIVDDQLVQRLESVTPDYVRRLALESSEGGERQEGFEIHTAAALEAIYFGYAERDIERTRTCKAKTCVAMAVRGSEYCLAHERQAAEVRERLHVVA
jgi:hypothetical protein